MCRHTCHCAASIGADNYRWCRQARFFAETALRRVFSEKDNKTTLILDQPPGLPSYRAINGVATAAVGERMEAQTSHSAHVLCGHSDGE